MVTKKLSTINYINPGLQEIECQIKWEKHTPINHIAHHSGDTLKVTRKGIRFLQRNEDQMDIKQN